MTRQKPCCASVPTTGSGTVPSAKAQVSVSARPGAGRSR
jgi:hypothetical protein